MPEIKLKGLGTEGNSYRIHLSAVVSIDSELIQSKDALSALQLFLHSIDLQRLLVNLTGAPGIMTVDYEDRIIKAEVDSVDNKGNCITSILNLNEEAIEQLRKNRLMLIKPRPTDDD